MSNCCSDRIVGLSALPVTSDTKTSQSWLVSSLEKVVTCKGGKAHRVGPARNRRGAGQGAGAQTEEGATLGFPNQAAPGRHPVERRWGEDDRAQGGASSRLPPTERPPGSSHGISHPRDPTRRSEALRLTAAPPPPVHLFCDSLARDPPSQPSLLHRALRTGEPAGLRAAGKAAPGVRPAAPQPLGAHSRGP